MTRVESTSYKVNNRLFERDRPRPKPRPSLPRNSPYLSAKYRDSSVRDGTYFSGVLKRAFGVRTVKLQVSLCICALEFETYTVRYDVHWGLNDLSADGVALR